MEPVSGLSGHYHADRMRPYRYGCENNKITGDRG